MDSKQILIDNLEYDFELEGKAVSSELLIAKAISKRDNKYHRKNQIVPLNCKWFYTSKENV